jgi:DNA-binding transcriptional LysR family regulator
MDRIDQSARLFGRRGKNRRLEPHRSGPPCHARTSTTRSVSPTDAGERLIRNVAPRLAEIGAEPAAVGELGDKPAGIIRITAIDHVIDQVLWPRLAAALEQYPDVRSGSARGGRSETAALRAR